MKKQKTIVIKSFKISEENFEIIKETADELCLKQQEVILLLLNRATQELKKDVIRSGGYKNLNFSLEKIKGGKKRK